MKSLGKRTLTGAIFSLILISGIAIHSYSFMVLFVVITILAMHEFYNLLSKNDIFPQRYTGISIGVLFFISNFLYATDIVDYKVFLIYIPLIAIVFISELYRKKDDPFLNIAYTIFGIIYIAVPFSILNHFVHTTNSELQFVPQILLGFVFIIWTYDTGAFLVGSAIGKNRLFERISPKKSWEGAVGGAIIALGITYIISIFFNQLAQIDWFIISIIIVVTGTYGDLTESMFKRSLNVKDSSNFLPGHGGILDRFDSIFISAPVVFVYLQLIN